MKKEQRMVKERSEDRSEDFRIKQTALLASPVFIGQAQGEGKHIKRKAKELSLSPAHWHTRLLFGLPSRLEDGFSCYLLNKIELVTLICLRAITRFVQDQRVVTR